MSAGTLLATKSCFLNQSNDAFMSLEDDLCTRTVYYCFPHLSCPGGGEAKVGSFMPACAGKHASSPDGDADEGVTLALVSPGSCMTHGVADVAITLRFVKRHVWRLVGAMVGTGVQWAPHTCQLPSTPPTQHNTTPQYTTTTWQQYHNTRQPCSTPPSQHSATRAEQFTHRNIVPQRQDSSHTTAGRGPH